MTQPLPLADEFTAPLRLLYVEDNRVNAMLFGAMLAQRGGVELQVAEDAAEALALITHWTPDVLVLDANLPDMSGHELLALLRNQLGSKLTPAFMCSADALDEDIAKAMATGFNGFWPKPIDIRQVLLDLLPYAVNEASATLSRAHDGGMSVDFNGNANVNGNADTVTVTNGAQNNGEQSSGRGA